jgi:hypothetical protein
MVGTIEERGLLEIPTYPFREISGSHGDNIKITTFWEVAARD